MLKWMKLKNLALVEEAEIEFGPGFNVITGETGAGKSVIMGAVDLLLGDRADKSAIRNGCDRCEIAAEFQIPACAAGPVAAILEDAAVEDDSLEHSILIRRVITKTSSRNFINGSPVTLSVLTRLGAVLIDVHAANASQSLLQCAEQLAVLDRFGHAGEHLHTLRVLWDELQSLREEQAEFLQTLPSEQDVKLLRRTAEDIRRAAPEPGEDETLKSRHALAANARSIMEYAYRAGEALAGDHEQSIFQNLTDVRRALLDLEKVDPDHAGEFISRLEEITEQVSNLSADLESHAASVELDGNEFLAMEDRMRVLQTLKRRYGPTLEDVLAYLADTEEKIQQFEDASMSIQQFAQKEKELLAKYTCAADALSRHRKDVSQKLVRELSLETEKLGFKQAVFETQFTTVPAGPGGTDHFELLFSANPGVPPCPLHQVASSGEISRVMLAVKTVLAEADAIPILIFDEIDANIGGETAWKVGDELRKLAGTKQILCISHLAQVARAAQTHFLVEKSTEENVTRTRIMPLTQKKREAELARMLGGGPAALQHAKEILSRQ